MTNTVVMTVVMTVIVVLLIGGGIALQIFLSKRESRWAGLILPIITLLFSLVAVSGVAVYRSVGGGAQAVSESGQIVQEVTQGGDIEPIGDTATTVFTVICVFVLYNIPTAALMAIYAACRGKMKQQKALGKMTVQDL